MELSVIQPPYKAWYGDLFMSGPSAFQFHTHKRLDDFLLDIVEYGESEFPDEIINSTTQIGSTAILRRWKELEELVNERLIEEGSSYRVVLKYTELDTPAPHVTFKMYDIDQIGGEEYLPLLEL